MVTDVPKGKLADILDNIKSTDQTCSLLSHLNKMFEVKAQMNDDTKFNDLFEDISIRIKHNGTYGNTSAATIKTYAVNEQEKNLRQKRLHFGGSGRRFRLIIESDSTSPWRIVSGVTIISELDPD